MRCDHAHEHDAEALFKRVRQEQGRLHLLVNNAWGGYAGSHPPTSGRLRLRLGDAMFERGLKARFSATYFAIPLMIERAAGKPGTRPDKPPGLIVSTVAWDRDRYIGNFYDVAKHSIVRFLWGMAEELREHDVATVARAPRFMRTERVMLHAKGVPRG